MSATPEEVVRLLYRKLRQGHSWEDWNHYMKGRCSKRMAQNVIEELRTRDGGLRRGGATRRALLEEILSRLMSHMVPKVTQPLTHDDGS